MDSSTEAVFDGLRAELVALRDPERAIKMSAYMKDHFPFLGVMSAPRRKAQKAAVAQIGKSDDGSPTAPHLLDFAQLCWDEPEREFQYVGSDALRKHHKHLMADDLDATKVLITTKSWWDTVDSLAAHTVGPLVLRNRELTKTMDEWIESDNMWLARTAIIHQLNHKTEIDADRLFRYADRRAGDTEFFIRKAIGWALRQHARVDPDAVRQFVESRGDKLSGLTRREAMKHLSA